MEAAPRFAAETRIDKANSRRGRDGDIARFYAHRLICLAILLGTGAAKLC